MRRRQLLTKAFNRVTLGVITAVTVNPFEVADSVVSSYSRAAVRPTPIDAESPISRTNVHNKYVRTYDWTDQLERRWRSKLSLERSEYVEEAEQSYGYLSAFGVTKTNRHAKRLTDQFAAATLIEGRPDGTLSEAARPERTIGFVHSLEYMIDPDSKRMPEYHRTVEETLVDGGGDYKGPTYLLVGILSQPPFEY